MPPGSSTGSIAPLATCGDAFPRGFASGARVATFARRAVAQAAEGSPPVYKQQQQQPLPRALFDAKVKGSRVLTMRASAHREPIAALGLASATCVGDWRTACADVPTRPPGPFGCCGLTRRSTPSAELPTTPDVGITSGHETVSMARTAPPRFSVRVLSRLPGATRAPYPGFIAPCLPTLRSEPPRGDGWLYEIKYDGSPYSWTVSHF
jgi:hypothetical protein